jgi:hypothetical protein
MIFSIVNSINAYYSTAKNLIKSTYGSRRFRQGIGLAMAAKIKR